MEGARCPRLAYAPWCPLLLNQEGFWSVLKNFSSTPGCTSFQNALNRKILMRRTLQRRSTFVQETLSCMPQAFMVMWCSLRHLWNQPFPAPASRRGKSFSAHPSSAKPCRSARAWSMSNLESARLLSTCTVSTKNCSSAKPIPRAFDALYSPPRRRFAFLSAPSRMAVQLRSP